MHHDGVIVLMLPANQLIYLLIYLNPLMRATRLSDLRLYWIDLLFY